MAIERDVGPGGALEQQAVEQAEVLIENALGQNPGVFNFDDGSAIVGEYTEMEATVEAAFDSNLADFMEEGDLNQISNDLIGNIDDDFSSRQDWEDTYKRGLDYLGMQNEESGKAGEVPNKYKGFSKLPEKVQEKISPDLAEKYEFGGKVKGKKNKGNVCRGGGAALRGTKFSGTK